MKKIMTVLLLACLLLTACSSKENIIIETNADDFDMNNYEKTEDVSIEADVILYNDNDLIITTDSIDSDSTETYLIITLENTSDADIFLSCESSAVNNFMITTVFSTDLAAGESLLTGISFDNTALNACEIQTITDIEFSLTAYDEDFSILYETDFLHIQTNKSGEVEQTINTNGVLLYDKDGIQLISKGFTTDEEWGDVLVLLAVNQSNRNIYVGLDDSTVIADDVTYEVNFGTLIPAGHQSISYLYFSDLDGNASTEITNALAVFTIKDTDTWKTITTTSEINFLQTGTDE